MDTDNIEAGLRALVEQWKSDSLDIQANYDARHPKMYYAKGLDDCAKQVAAYLATRTSKVDNQLVEPRTKAGSLD